MKKIFSIITLVIIVLFFTAMGRNSNTNFCSPNYNGILGQVTFGGSGQASKLFMYIKGYPILHQQQQMLMDGIIFLMDCCKEQGLTQL